MLALIVLGIALWAPARTPVRAPAAIRSRAPLAPRACEYDAAPEGALVPASSIAGRHPPERSAASPEVAPDLAFLWAMLDGASASYTQRDRMNLYGALGVLLTKAELAAARARAAPGADAPNRHGVGIDLNSSDALAVLSAVTTARELLAIGLDVTIVAAAMLGGSALTRSTPSWPLAAPDAFSSAVDALLTEERRLTQLARGDAPPLRTEPTGPVVGLLGPADDELGPVGSELGTAGGELARRVAAAEWDNQAASDLRLAMLSSTTEPRALLVLLACRLAELRAAQAAPAPLRQALASEGVRLYAPLAQAVGFGVEFAEIESRSYEYLFPNELARVYAWYAQTWPDADALLANLKARLRAHLEAAPALQGLLSSVHVSGRAKKVESTFKKVITDGLGRLDAVMDVIAMRVVFTPADDAPAMLAARWCSNQQPATEPGVEAGAEVITTDDGAELITGDEGAEAMSEAEAESLLCYGVHGEVRRLWNEVPGRLKDFVSSPKPNGYQSIHTNVRLPDGRVAEVQVRSAAMHARAEHGMAAHGLYKGGLTEPAQLAALAEVSNRLKTRALPASGATPTSESSAVPVGLGQSDVAGSADSDVVAP